MISDKQKQTLLFDLSQYDNVFRACQKSGISRAQYYRLIKKNDKFKEATEEAKQMGRENIADIAEMALLKKVNEGDQKAIEYALKHNSLRYKDRIYGQSKQSSQQHSEPLPPIVIEVIKPNKEVGPLYKIDRPKSESD